MDPFRAEGGPALKWVEMGCGARIRYRQKNHNASGNVL